MIEWAYLVFRFAGYGFAVAGLFASLHDAGARGAGPLSGGLLAAGFACFLVSCILWLVLRRRRAKERAAAREGRRQRLDGEP